MRIYVLDGGGPKVSENTLNSFLTKCGEKVFWQIGADGRLSTFYNTRLICGRCIGQRTLTSHPKNNSRWLINIPYIFQFSFEMVEGSGACGQLLKSSMAFACRNMTALLETRALDDLSGMTVEHFLPSFRDEYSFSDLSIFPLPDS